MKALSSAYLWDSVQFSRSVVSDSLQPHGIGIILNCPSSRFLKIWEIVWVCANSLDTEAPLTEDHLGLIKLTGSHSIRFKIFMFSSVTQSCPTLCDPMNHSTPGLPVHHQLPKYTHTHVHWVNDAIQPSHPLSSPSPLAFNLSQHQGLQMSQLSASGGQSTGVSASTSVLPMNTQDWTPLGWTGWIQSKGLSRVFFNTTVQKHQFFSA